MIEHRWAITNTPAARLNSPKSRLCPRGATPRQEALAITRLRAYLRAAVVQRLQRKAGRACTARIGD
ncbi:MAG: hypothetical protein MI924_25800 [Chloroflexales bacterium]|nr:hypothetical protein [Chloroflexales bacterium]